MSEILNHCQACLSSDRKLYPVSKLGALFQDISVWDLSTAQGGVCWECHHIMRKFSRFKAQVRETQYMLYHTKLSDLKSLSTLCIKPKDYQNEYNFSTELKSETNIKLDLRIKEEIDEKKHLNEQFVENHSVEENIDEEHSSEDSDDNFQPIVLADHLDVNIMEFKISKESCDQKNIIRPEKPVAKENQEQDIYNKFTLVVYTEEELQKNREEKRSHPNFKKIPYKCESCVLGFLKKELFDLHVETRHDEKMGEHVCHVCLCRFPSEDHLARHVSHHYSCYRCKFCKYESLQLAAAAVHARDKHFRDTEANVHCPHCSTVTQNGEELSRHIAAEHFVYCDKCGAKFKGINSLQSHTRRVHKVPREFTCDLCSKTFKTKSRMESHMIRHNATLAQKLAYCTTCNVQYKNLYVYRNHLRTSANHAQKTYECVDCKKHFVSQNYWKRHYKFYHLRQSSFRCDICDKLFMSDSRLRSHMQIKHGSDRSRDYHCNVCGKQFFTLATLKCHELTHSELRSFMCEDCGDTFKQRPALYTHYKLVHRGLKRRRKAA